jgi:hypothetical protein
MTIQSESETAVHAQVVPDAFTAIVPDPPDCEKLSDESPSCITQSAGACVTLACLSFNSMTARRIAGSEFGAAT